MNILFVGIHKELIDAYDKQIDVARKMINQFSIGIRISDQQFFKFRFIQREPVIKENEAYMVAKPSLSKRLDGLNSNELNRREVCYEF